MKRKKSKIAVATSVGKKYIMSLTGFFLLSFLIAHLSGNLLLLKGPNEFNAYAEFMSTNGVIRVMEIVLLIGFLTHIGNAIILNVGNKKARPVRYHVNAGSQNSSFASRNMAFTGALVLVFLVVHLRGFFVESRFLQPDTGMYDIVVAAFSNGYYVSFYVISMLILMVHLKHGFESAFYSLGLRHRTYSRWISIAGTIYAIVIPAGYISLPLYFYFNK